MKNGRNKEVRVQGVFPKGWKKWVTKPVTDKKSYSFVQNLMKDSNEVFLRVTNHTGQAEKNLLGRVFLCLSGMVRHSEKHLITILHPSSLSHINHLNPNERCLVNGSQATSTIPARIPKNIGTPRPSKDEVIKAHKSRMGKNKL